jgi:predicted RNA-binding protein YlxR (DUF448 family)
MFVDDRFFRVQATKMTLIVPRNDEAGVENDLQWEARHRAAWLNRERLKSQKHAAKRRVKYVCGVQFWKFVLGLRRVIYGFKEDMNQ